MCVGNRGAGERPARANALSGSECGPTGLGETGARRPFRGETLGPRERVGRSCLRRPPNRGLTQCRSLPSLRLS
jgi:hypothetical protein